MARPPVLVRRVDESTVDAFCQLWAQARTGGEQGSDGGGRQITEEAVRAALGRPEVVAFVASAESGPVGYAVVSDATLSTFSGVAGVAVEQIYVLGDHRRQGVARALMGAVATYADRHGSDQVACWVPSAGKDANRFFARMGFAPQVMRRVTSTAALQRKLAGVAEGGRPSLERVLVRRRAARVAASRERLAAH